MSMYKPDLPFDTVIVQAHSNVTGELEWTVGSATDATDDGEHFVVATEMPWIDEIEVTAHYEDIYAYSPEKMEKLKR